MSKRIQLRRGTTTEHDSFTGAVGEVTVDTTNKTLRVHDGTTAGGTRLATLTGGLVPVSQLPDATTSIKGVVVLNNTLTSTSTTQALTAAQGKVLNEQSFGVSQNWGNFTESRSLYTTYTNTTGKPIVVTVTGNNSSASERLILTIGGVVVWDQIIDGEGSSTNVVVSGIVPTSTTYSVGTTTGFDTTIARWVELR